MFIYILIGKETAIISGLKRKASILDHVENKNNKKMVENIMNKWVIQDIFLAKLFLYSSNVLPLMFYQTFTESD